MQLSLAGTHGSSTTHPGWAASGGAASISLRRVATSVSPERRRSMAISRPSWSSGSASTGRQATGSVKLLRYWIQSQTTRSRVRSTPVALSAPKTGPSAAGMSTAPGPRSFVTARMSMCTAAPGAGADRAGEPGAGENLRDAAGEPRRHDVHAADPRYLEDLLDDLRAHGQSLVGHPVGRDAAQPPADPVRYPQARDVAPHVLQR